MYFELPNYSSRDDLGRSITDKDWNEITKSLKGIFDNIYTKYFMV